MLQTQTGGFPIGFREVGTWKVDSDALFGWAREQELAVIDLVTNAVVRAEGAKAAGLQVGAADLPRPKGMITADAERRAAAVSEACEFVEAAAEAGIENILTIMLPEDPSVPRQDNFAYMVAAYREIGPILEEQNCRLVIEGWPGPGCVCSTPEGYRAFFEECPTPCFGINYDPSHLMRMGIDPLRFLREFAGRVHHVHGKDAELAAEKLYEYGWEVPSLSGERPAFGGDIWRYTIPGHGQMRWTAAFEILAENGYNGSVCIELEDARFNRGSGDSEQRALVLASRFLSGC